MGCLCVFCAFVASLAADKVWGARGSSGVRLEQGFGGPGGLVQARCWVQGRLRRFQGGGVAPGVRLKEVQARFWFNAGGGLAQVRCEVQGRWVRRVPRGLGSARAWLREGAGFLRVRGGSEARFHRAQGPARFLRGPAARFCKGSVTVLRGLLGVRFRKRVLRAVGDIAGADLFGVCVYV